TAAALGVVGARKGREHVARLEPELVGHGLAGDDLDAPVQSTRRRQRRNRVAAVDPVPDVEASWERAAGKRAVPTGVHQRALLALVRGVGVIEIAPVLNDSS